MKTIFLLLIMSLTACSKLPSHTTDVQAKFQDEFEQILYIMKYNFKDSALKVFGVPDKISNSLAEKNIEIIEYKKPFIKIHLDTLTDKIVLINYFYSKDFNDYKNLKQRFKNLEWKENKLQDSDHVITDRYFVTVPEIKMSFEYDKESPKVFCISFGPTK